MQMPMLLLFLMLLAVFCYFAWKYHEMANDSWFTRNGGDSTTDTTTSTDATAPPPSTATPPETATPDVGAASDAGAPPDAGAGAGASGGEL